MATKQQFRPVFTMDDLLYLQSLLKEQQEQQGKRLSLYIATYIMRVNVGLNAVAYEAKERVSLVESLGLDSPVEKKLESNASELYQKKLETKVALGGKAVLDSRETYNLLAARYFADKSSLSAEEIEECKKLELELFNMSLGTFDQEIKGE